MIPSTTSFDTRTNKNNRNSSNRSRNHLSNVATATTRAALWSAPLRTCRKRRWLSARTGQFKLWSKQPGVFFSCWWLEWIVYWASPNLGLFFFMIGLAFNVQCKLHKYIVHHCKSCATLWHRWIFGCNMLCNLWLFWSGASIVFFKIVESFRIKLGLADKTVRWFKQKLGLCMKQRFTVTKGPSWTWNPSPNNKMKPTNPNADTYVDKQRQYLFVTFPANTLVRHPEFTHWGDTLVGHPCLTRLRNALVRHSWETLL